jgi:hypothetical protein
VGSLRDAALSWTVKRVAGLLDRHAAIGCQLDGYTCASASDTSPVVAELTATVGLRKRHVAAIPQAGRHAKLRGAAHGVRQRCQLTGSARQWLISD